VDFADPLRRGFATRFVVHAGILDPSEAPRRPSDGNLAPVWTREKGPVWGRPSGNAAARREDKSGPTAPSILASRNQWYICQVAIYPRVSGASEKPRLRAGAKGSRGSLVPATPVGILPLPYPFAPVLGHPRASGDKQKPRLRAGVQTPWVSPGTHGTLIISGASKPLTVEHGFTLRGIGYSERSSTNSSKDTP
jgi:hypothetical protein